MSTDSEKSLPDCTKRRLVIVKYLLNYILENQYIEFSGGPKIGKSALAKMIALELERRGIYAIVVDCKKRGSLLIKDLQKAEELCICEAYGKSKLQIYQQKDNNN